MEGEQDIYNYIKELENQNAELSNKNVELNGGLSASYFGNQEERTLIHYQLEAEELLERINRQLSGEVPVMDLEGNIDYVKAEDTELITLNDKGKAGVMYILGLYINKNSFLTNLDLNRIYEILYKLGNDLNDFFYCNLTTIGLDTPQKKSKYPLLINSILDAVEFGLRRSIGGAESQRVNEKRIVTESSGFGRQSPLLSMGSSKPQKFNIFNPKSW